MPVTRGRHVFFANCISFGHVPVYKLVPHHYMFFAAHILFGHLTVHSVVGFPPLEVSGCSLRLKSRSLLTLHVTGSQDKHAVLTCKYRKVKPNQLFELGRKQKSQLRI